MSPDATAAVQTIADHVSAPPNKGSMYQVDINADPSQMLDWDKPLSKQSQVVQDNLASLGLTDPNATGGDMHVALRHRYMQETGDAEGPTKQDRINASSSATSALQQAGIPGISYLDAGSRAAGDGTRNHVVFDPQNIAIQKKYMHGGIVG
jgi:hypothetical protein